MTPPRRSFPRLCLGPMFGQELLALCALWLGAPHWRKDEQQRRRWRALWWLVGIVGIGLATLILASCASAPPTPDWVPAIITPAEQAEAECRNSPAVSEARIAWQLRARHAGPLAKNPEKDAMEACMALKGFKRS
jgi:hypothetical protein